MSAPAEPPGIEPSAVEPSAVERSAVETWARHRPLLFTVAYEILGSAADAEDAVQETWLRWAEVDLDRVRDLRAYLVRIVTRQALNRLRTLARRREAYVGPWLPAPLLTSPDVAEDVVLADAVSTAMLVVLETLSPAERAVFVLREVFALPYDEIAAAVGKSPAAVRQVAHRARAAVHARGPRQDATRPEREAVVQRFVVAANTGDLQGLMDVLAPDLVLLSDGGGNRRAALRPIRGVEKVLRFLAGVRPPGGQLQAELGEVNGGPALLLLVGGEIDTVATVRLEQGVVTELYLVRNPDKLAELGRAVQLAR